MLLWLIGVPASPLTYQVWGRNARAGGLLKYLRAEGRWVPASEQREERCTASGTRWMKRRYPTIRSRPIQKLAFSTFLSTLPAPVIGNSSTNFTCLGACADPFLAFTRLINSSALDRVPSRPP